MVGASLRSNDETMNFELLWRAVRSRDFCGSRVRRSEQSLERRLRQRLSTSQCFPLLLTPRYGERAGHEAAVTEEQIASLEELRLSATALAVEPQLACHGRSV